MAESFEREASVHVSVPYRADQTRADPTRADIPRPDPPRRLSEIAQAWLGWFGVARMLSVGVTLLLVGAGGYWLLNAPPPPVEASLPFATTTVAGSAVASTTDTPSDASPSVGLVTGTTGPPTTVPGPAHVHVAGAVLMPGVYQLDADARVVDAIEAARGPTPDAMLDGVNLAAPVGDGQRIYVPRAGEIDPATVDNGPSAHATDPAAPTPVTGPIDINRATADQLLTLPGVGPSTAAAIIDDRDRNGPFATVDDLDRVAGIGPAKLEAMRELVTV